MGNTRLPQQLHSVVVALLDIESIEVTAGIHCPNGSASVFKFCGTASDRVRKENCWLLSALTRPARASAKKVPAASP